MATYTLQSPPHAGAAITFVTSPATGDVAPCGTGQVNASAPGSALLVVGPSSSSMTVSLPGLTDDGLAVGPRVVTVPSGQTWLIPLPSSVYGSTVTITYGGTLTAAQVACIMSPAS